MPLDTTPPCAQPDTGRTEGIVGRPHRAWPRVVHGQVEQPRMFTWDPRLTDYDLRAHCEGVWNAWGGSHGRLVGPVSCAVARFGCVPQHWHSVASATLLEADRWAGAAHGGGAGSTGELPNDQHSHLRPLSAPATGIFAEV
jgi:hypothetical protein